jgi:hypothetical protein
MNDSIVRKLAPNNITNVSKTMFPIIPSPNASLGLDFTNLTMYNKYHANIQ